MYTSIRFAALIVGVAMLAGCTTMSEGQYNNVQATVGGSPSAKRAVINECIENVQAEPLAEKKQTAAIFNIKLANYPSTYCNRLWGAVASGRITYADYRKLSSPSADNSKVIRIMQGR